MNTKREGGWELYREMTTNNNNLDSIAKENSEDSDRIMKKMDNEMNRIKSEAFGKVKEKKSKGGCKELDKLQKEKKEILNKNEGESKDEELNIIEDKITEVILTKQREGFEKELKSIKDIKVTKGKSAAIFKLKGKITGLKSSCQEATVLVDPASGEEVTTPEEIKRVSLQYCKDLLTNRKPKDEYAEDYMMKEFVHDVRMTEKIEDDIEELSSVKFNRTYGILTKKLGSKYDFIVKGGPSMKAALFKLCQVVWRTEKQPVRWSKSTLVQCYKGKGLRTVLDNMRPPAYER